MSTLALPGAGRNYVAITAASPDQSILDIDPATVIELYKAHGALMLRGFDFNVGIFRKLTRRFCYASAFNNSPGRQVIDAGNNIQTVNLGNEAFPLHPEMAREPWKPDVSWFGCLSPPPRGGETTLCDGVALVRELPRDLRDILLRQRLRYMQPVSVDDCRLWFGCDRPTQQALAHPPDNCPFTFSVEQGVLVRSFTVPFLHRPMFSAELAFGNFLFFARYGLNNTSFPTLEDGSEVPDEWVRPIKDIADRHQVAVKWQQNDVVMLDNTRFMHGRNKIPDPATRLILTFFGYLKFAEPGPEELPGLPWRSALVQ